MPRHTLVLRDGSGADHEVEITEEGSVVVGDRVIAAIAIRPGEIRAGDRIVWAASNGDMRWVFIDGQVHTFDVQVEEAYGSRRARQPGGLAAPMPATVARILVSAGAHVRAGDILIILEAMKMELPVRASSDGVVATVRCREGELVQPGQDLIEITPDVELPIREGATPTPKTTEGT